MLGLRHPSMRRSYLIYRTCSFTAKPVRRVNRMPRNHLEVGHVKMDQQIMKTGRSYRLTYELQRHAPIEQRQLHFFAIKPFIRGKITALTEDRHVALPV